ncbi:SpoIIE family protein phosphatase [Microbacterium sp. NM3R9]|uniref:SpoIIE family protein phosphatase n=1 Tax=Microbacterium thalli TaxID=3027921 RepID=UPI002365B313|nr:GAF domain-containing SpoIIE family protein phosphatase [Microbacterium thalli]MDN8549813.1 SpoIIE family protein phosphatase [Microbacterium thalli]
MTQQIAANDEAVVRLGLMDSPPEERFDRITRLARERFQVDFAVMNVVNSETVFTKSQPSTSNFRHTPIEDSFCGEAVKQPAVLEVRDGREDPRFADRAIVAEHGIRFYAGYPIHTEAGETVGTLCLLDTSPRELTDSDREAFEQLGLWAQAEMRMDDPADDPDAVAPGDPAAVERDPAAAPTAHADQLAGGEVRLASLAIPYGRVSGDRSSWQQLGDRVIVTLADVMGKGEVAGSFAEELISALQDRAHLEPVEAMLSVEEFARHEPRYRETFATLFHAVIDPRSGRVSYVDAGHGLTLLLRPDGSTERLSSRNLPLGLRPIDADWEAGETTVASGDLIVSVSDGALDAYDCTLESLRLIGEDLRRAREAEAFFDRLAIRVSEHVVDDDVTAVVVSVR